MNKNNTVDQWNRWFKRQRRTTWETKFMLTSFINANAKLLNKIAWRIETWEVTGRTLCLPARSLSLWAVLCSFQSECTSPSPFLSFWDSAYIYLLSFLDVSLLNIMFICESLDLSFLFSLALQFLFFVCVWV